MVSPAATAVLVSTKVELTSALPAPPELPEHPGIPVATTIAPKKRMHPDLAPTIIFIERLLIAGDSAARGVVPADMICNSLAGINNKLEGAILCPWQQRRWRPML
jgi:hypothetical protein